MFWQEKDEEREALAYIRRFTRRQWCGTWCAMLRHNVFACVRDTSEGVRKPRFSTAARSGPYPLREPAGSTGDGPTRHPSFNVVGTVNTPVVVHSRGLNKAGSGASARDVIRNPPRQSSRFNGERAPTATFDGMSAVEGAASGKGLIQRGVNSSALELPSLPAASPEAFDWADPNENASLAGRSEVEGVASGRGVIERRMGSSGIDESSDCAPLAAMLDSTAHEESVSFNDMGAVKGGCSGRGLIDKGVQSSGRDTDIAVVPLAATVFGTADGDEDVARTCSEQRLLTALRFSGGGVGATQVGASSTGPITGDGLEGSCGFRRSSAPPYQNNFVLGQVAPGQKDVQGAKFSSNTDVTSSERGSATRGLSGRKIIRHGESNEYEHDNLPPSEGVELGADDVSGAVRAAVGGGSSGKLAFDRLGSCPPIENDAPERRVVASVGTAAVSAAGGLPSSTASWDSAGHFGDGHLNGEGVDSSSSGKSARGLSRLPWGSRGPTEVDVPRRRSTHTSGHMRVAAESEVFRADSVSHRPHLLDGSKGEQGLGTAPSRYSVGSRSSAAESNASSRDRSGEVSGGSPYAFTRDGEHDDPSSPDGADVGAVAAENGVDLAGLDVSASHRSSKKGGVGGWGVKSRAPIAVDLPRRRSGYSADASAHSTEKTSVAAEPLQDAVADDSGAEGDGSDRDERGALNVSGRRESSVFAGLAGLYRGPVESDLPRRRRSSEMSGEGVVPPMEGVVGRGADGTSDASANDDEAASESSASASRGLSDKVSARGGWRSGIKSRAPVVVDLPRRSSGYSADVSGRSVDSYDIAVSQSLRLQQGGNADHGDTEGMKSDADAGVDPARQGSSGAPGVHADRKSLFPALAGHKRAPVQSDLPRRRPSKHSTAWASTAGGATENVSAGVVDVSESQGVDIDTSTSESGKRGTLWGLRGEAPIACDVPRRSSVRSSAPSHAATVVAREDTSLDAGTANELRP